MHILFLSDIFAPELSAAANRVYERALYWVRWGHQVTIITCVPNFPDGKVYPGYHNKWYQVEEMHGIRVVRVKTFMAKNTGTFLRSLDFLSYFFMATFSGLFQKRPDVIMTTSPQLFSGVAGWLLSVLKWRPFVLEISDLWPGAISALGAMQNNYLLKILEKLELFLYKRAQAIIVLSPAFKPNMVKRGVKADKITVVLNGAMTEFLSPTVLDTTVKIDHHLQGKFIAGFIGTHGMAHQLETLIDAAELLKEDKAIHFLFVGDGARKQALVAYATQKALRNVTFLPKQPKEQIAPYWNACDVAIVHVKNIPEFSEIIPSKLFDAMCMGIPIILAAPKGVASQMVVDEECGIAIPAEEPQPLAQAIQQMLKNKTRYIHYQQSAKQAAKKYTRERQAEKTLQVIQETIVR